MQKWLTISLVVLLTGLVIAPLTAQEAVDEESATEEVPFIPTETPSLATPTPLPPTTPPPTPGNILTPTASPVPVGTIADFIIQRAEDPENPQLTQFLLALQLLEDAGVVEPTVGTLIDRGATLNPPLTVFVPTDGAMLEAVGQSLAAPDFDTAIERNPELVRSILLYHIVPGSYTTEQLLAAGEGQLVTGLGIPLLASERGGAVYVDNLTQVVAANFIADNGVMHVVDRVLLPPFEVEGQDLWLANGDVPILARPGTVPTGRVLEGCKTFYINAYSQGFFRVDTLGGWVDPLLLVDVDESYAQPDGQDVLPQCVE